ncbi:MAG TPA: hypothetical protein VLD62_11360 [Acidimicrobiia bacterium]|nr:hypothetical protein [Acidimicrobiia bacterium]
MADLDAAVAALDTCSEVVAELDLRCCDPGRSPSMQRLAETIDRARAHLSDDPSVEGFWMEVEDAGAQVSRLQVACCAPNRLPLYTRVLGELTAARMAFDSAHGLGH